MRGKLGRIRYNRLHAIRLEERRLAEEARLAEEERLVELQAVVLRDESPSSMV